MNQNQRHTGPTGQKFPLSNAERQRRFRERRRLLDNPPPDVRTIDLFGGVTPAVTSVQVDASVTPSVTLEPVQDVTDFVMPRYYLVELPSGVSPRVMGCPFCGRAPDVYQPEFFEHWVIQCRPCRCYVPRVEESRLLSCVVVSWNTRGGRLGGAS